MIALFKAFNKSTNCGVWPTKGTKNKATPQGGFGNEFGNKGVVYLQTLVIPIDMAEEAGFEPAVGY